MTGISDWRGRTGGGWAAEWRRTDRSFAELTAHLLGRIEDIGPAGAVLDIGCGAGELALALAELWPKAQIIGVDVSPDLIEAADQRAKMSGGTQAAFVLADAAEWQPPQGIRPNLLVSRHGVMFFDDPVAAFEYLGSIAAPGARLAFSCFRSLAENPFFAEIGALLPPPAEPPDPNAPGPFAFADPQKVERILAASSWCKIDFEPFDFAMIIGKGHDPVADAVAYFQRIGPAARALREMEDDERAALLDAIRALATRHCRDGIVALGAAAWIVTARAA